MTYNRFVLRESAAVGLLLAVTAGVAVAAGPEGACATSPEGRRHLLALHRYWSQSGALLASAGAADTDQDDVAVLVDRGDLVARRNPFDLDGASLRLSPNSDGGFDPARMALGLDPAGSRLGLGDDDAAPVDLPFRFPFFGRDHSRVFVHSDGTLTFGEPDVAASERGVSRLLAGPPRIAPFFADLDPSRGGTVTASLGADRAVFLWTDVPGRGQVNRNTFQVTLLPAGTIDFVYGPRLSTREAVVGVSPGATFDSTAADLSSARPVGSAGALVERFSETERLDLVGTVRRFFVAHPDVFDQIVVYTTRPLNPFPGSLAFAVNVRNEVRGIGIEVFDASREWGAAGRLATVVFMDSIDSYLEVDGFEILGQEVGHRWLSRIRFRDHAGAESTALLGRGQVHWSFFMDSDASTLEGNDLEDRGGGRFLTVDIARRYSALDQYAMGLRDPGEVPPFFYVDAPDDFRPNRAFKTSSAPEAGVSFTGIRREVRIEDVLAVMGPRQPEAARAPRLLRPAFVLVADDAAPATETRRRAVARIRARFESYYREATDGRGIADTRLR